MAATKGDEVFDTERGERDGALRASDVVAADQAAFTMERRVYLAGTVCTYLA